MDLNGVQVGPFGPKLGQNDAPYLGIIFQALLGPKNRFKNNKNPDFAQGRRHEAKPPKSAAVRLRTGNGVSGWPCLLRFLARLPYRYSKETLSKRTHFSEYSLGDPQAMLKPVSYTHLTLPTNREV